MANKQRQRHFLKQMRSVRQQELVTAASGLLVRKGCRDLRVEDVAEECGVAKGTCYQHFGSRPELVSTAILHLDKALAERLSTPAKELATSPHQLLQRAVIEAVDAQILTLEHRGWLAESRTPALVGAPWPCCLGSLRCPYGGARHSVGALGRWIGRLPSRHHEWAAIAVAQMLAVPAAAFVQPEAVRSRTAIRSTASRLLRRLLP